MAAAHYTFVRLEVEREACAALLLLLEALERGEAATELLAAATADLRRGAAPVPRPCLTAPCTNRTGLRH